MKRKEINMEKMKEIAKNRRTQYAYAPNRLSVEHRPELYAFPLNVLFAAWRTEDDGSTMMGHAIYEPSLSSYVTLSGEEGQRGAAMTYINKYNGEGRFCFVTILWDADKQTYIGIKTVNGEDVVTVHGDEWYTFFYEFTSKGLYNGEACRFGAPSDQAATVDS